MTPTERYEIVPTRDGSFTLYDRLYSAHFHSVHGAITESMHVYIKNGLEYFIENYPNHTSINLFEMGLGSGMNAWLTREFAQARTGHTIRYIACEKHPLSPLLIQKFIEKHQHLKNHQRWNIMMQEVLQKNIYTEEHFELSIIRDDISSLLSHCKNEKFDVIYWDAFGPAQHPEAWTEKIFEKLMPLFNIPCVLTTFCTQGHFKRILKNLDFEITKLPGPPGKKEVLRGVYNRRKF